MPALFHLDLGLLEEYDPWIQDALKWFCILFTLHLFKVLGGASELLDAEFLQNVIVAVIGLSVYHLILQKSVKIVYKEDAEEGFAGTFRLFKRKNKKKRKRKKHD